MRILHEIKTHYSEMNQDPAFYKRIMAGILLLALALIFNGLANYYTELHAGNGVINDLFLDNLPVINVDWIFLEGMLALVFFVIAVGVHRIGRVPFMLKAVALFVIIRCFFIILTHVSSPVGMSLVPQSPILRELSSGDDLFFSFHTGFPFLMALMFWPEKFLRFTFLILSFIFGAAVLLGHLHYSIDVFAAFFITFGIFALAKWMFAKDYFLFNETL